MQESISFNPFVLKSVNRSERGEVEFVKKMCKPLLIEIIELHKRADIMDINCMLFVPLKEFLLILI